MSLPLLARERSGNEVTKRRKNFENVPYLTWWNPILMIVGMGPWSTYMIQMCFRSFDEWQKHNESCRFWTLLWHVWAIVFMLALCILWIFQKLEFDRKEKGVAGHEPKSNPTERTPLLVRSTEIEKISRYGAVETQKARRSQGLSPQQLLNATCDLISMIYVAFGLWLIRGIRVHIVRNNWTDGILVALLMLGVWHLVRVFRITMSAMKRLRQRALDK